MAVWIYAVVQNPGCPEHTQVDEFQIEYFLGRWYEMYRSEDDDRNQGECVTAEFLLRSDYLIRVAHSYQDEVGFRSELIGRARWPEPPKGELEIKYEAFSPWESYSILETDYSNYAVAYSCYTRFGVWNHDHLWVLTRQPAQQYSKLWNAYKNVALQAIKRAFVDPEEQDRRTDTFEYLVATDQGDDICIYPPETDFENPQ